MPGQSSTILPAVKVAKASRAALTALIEDRDALRQQLITSYADDWAKNHPFKHALYGRSGVGLLPEHFAIIWKQHREQDQHVLESLLDLARAAADTNAAFNVEVTVEDFRLIRKFYPMGDKK